MSDIETYFIKRIKIDGLFKKIEPVNLDFNSGMNCIYGANGSGKTTIINILIAALNCDTDKLLMLPFSKLTVYVSKKSRRRMVRFFSAQKTSSKPGVPDQITFAFADNMVSGRITPTSPMPDIKAIIDETISVNYLPLHRFNEYDSGDAISMRVAKSLRLKGLDDDDVQADPIRRMLRGLQGRFKEEYLQKQRSIRQDLELLKDKVLEKLLIDDALVATVRESELKKKDITSEDYKQAKAKLDGIGLRLPSEKLEKHFATIIHASTNVFKKRDAYAAALKASPAYDQEKRDSILAEYGVALRIYRALDPIHNRLMSIIGDVEKSTEYRIATLQKFKDFEDIINDFFVNKSFEFSESGEFRIVCRGSEIKIEELSSGEKHILALLGKVALSSKDGGVFIADEPELSLHLSWQRKLLPSLNKISPNMQIIVATHAPAIIPSSAGKIDLDELNYDAAPV